MRQGIDVSSYQHPNDAVIDYAQVAASGVSWCAVKISEGLTYVNPYGPADCAGMTSVGVEVVPYHFAQPGASDGGTQARFFLQHCPSLVNPANGALDLEENGNLGLHELVAWIEAFRVASGISVLYVNHDYLSALTTFGYTWPGKLWIAAPSDTEFPAGAFAWQYSEGDVPGISATTDLDQITEQEPTDMPLDDNDKQWLTTAINTAADNVVATMNTRVDDLAAGIAAVKADVDALPHDGPAPGGPRSGTWTETA